MGTIVGNTLSASHDVIYQVILGAVSVDSPITSDNIINSVEQNNLFISGTSDISNTVTVAVSDGTSTVSSVVTVTSNTWSAILDVSSLVDGPVIVSVTGVDALSSVYTDATSATLQTTLPSLSVDEPLFDDNVINEDESTGDIISGTGTPGDVITVTLTDGGNTITETVIVGGDGTWEVTVNTETLNDGPITITTSTTDEVGNVSTTVTIVEQDTSGPTSTINTPVSGDDIVNAVEDNSLTLNGESEPDSMVTVTLTDENGDTVTVMTTTDQNGDWNINNIDISGLDDGPITVTVMATDEFGNEGLPSTHTIEHTTNGPVVSINTPIEGDNIINAMEEETTDISGVGTPGTIIDVFVTDGSTTITTTVIVPDSGIWTTTLDVSSLDDGPITITATGTNPAGNDVSTTISVDHTTTPPPVTINTPIAGDNIVDSNEETSVVITGTSSPGSTLIVTVTNGVNEVVSGTITVPSSGIWTTTLNLSPLDEGLVSVVATATNTIGNVGHDTVFVVLLDVVPACPDLPTPICGNGICEPEESTSDCSIDCLINDCGNGVCEPHENDVLCSIDCTYCGIIKTCGNDVCDVDENAGSCPDDCSTNPPCGNGVCDPEENAGSCPSDCDLIPTRFGDNNCDPEENGGNCSEDCSNDNPISCGNSVCDSNENAGNCPEDCSLTFCNSDGICDPFESAEFCSDCTTLCNNNGFCDPNEMVQTCDSDCGNLPSVVVIAFLDENLNGISDLGIEYAVPNVIIYLDLDFDGEYDSLVEPIYTTRGDPAQVEIQVRPGTYQIGVTSASLGSLAIGWVEDIGQETFVFNTNERVIVAEIAIPLSVNLPPVAQDFDIEVTRSMLQQNPLIIFVHDIINSNTDPNNNIDITDGFIMDSFPSAFGSYSFDDGTLAVFPSDEVPDDFIITYHLCDLGGLCSSFATISFDFPDVDPAPPVPIPVTPVVTPVIVVVTTPVPTPVIVYVFEDDEFGVGLYDSTSSDASSLYFPTILLVIFAILLC